MTMDWLDERELIEWAHFDWMGVNCLDDLEMIRLASPDWMGWNDFMSLNWVHDRGLIELSSNDLDSHELIGKAWNNWSIVH